MIQEKPRGSAGQLDRGQLLDDFEVAWFLDFDPNACSLGIAFCAVDELEDRPRKTVTPGLVDGLVAKGEGRHKRAAGGG